MAIIEIDGKSLELDKDGFLADPASWEPAVAELLAKQDGIESLNDKHWAIINYIRSAWEEKGMAPMVRNICKETGIRLREFYELFPQGPGRGACRAAGLPKPEGCV
jgi:TusE/DsrC/DsvC family sulfur relay protein